MVAAGSADDTFRTEIAAIAAAHKAKEAGRIGDGMAAEGSEPGRPNAWMDFSGARVPIEPENGPSHDVRLLKSVMRSLKS